MKKKICISGYYGHDNFGDETILELLVQNLRKMQNVKDITVLSADAQKTYSMLAVPSVRSFSFRNALKAIKNCDCLISGGGSLLQDVTSKKSLMYYLGILTAAQLMFKETIIFAQGIGPINDKKLETMTKLVLKRAKYVSVRDEASYNLLKSWNIKADLFDDPVWNINICKQPSTNKVGIQLRRWDSLTDDKLRKIAEQVNKHYANKEILVLSLQHKMDYEICDRLVRFLKEINECINASVVKYDTNEEMIKTIASLDELIAMRYHACLVGIKAGVKVLPLSYDVKVENLAKQFNLNYVDMNACCFDENAIEKFKNTSICYDQEKICKLAFDFSELEKHI